MYKRQVLAAPDSLPVARRPRARFYAHLYVGLYHEALSNASAAREHLAAAAADEYARAGGYMHTVARVHVDLLERAATR